MKRERAPRLLAQQKQGQHRECWKLAELAKALWETVAPVAREQNFARAWTAAKVEVPRRLALVQVKRKQAATELDLPAERSRLEQAWMPGSMEPEPMWMQAPQELRKRKPEPTELLTEQERVALRLENPPMVTQALQAAKPRELALVEKKLPEPLAWPRNNVRPPR